ncbi:hypothetical protein D4R89_06475 [bacterium]|nr:MAG: hypothetical protein D4R89_06475 [bacterium]
MRAGSSGSTVSSTHGLHECGFFRPIVKDVVERYLDYGNPRCGFARIRCPDCGEERSLLDVRLLFTKIDSAARPAIYFQHG